MGERYSKLKAELEGKTADKVFDYFGADGKYQSGIIERIFSEYMKSNDPALLPKEAPGDLVNMCKECFKIIQDAHETLTDETKKTALFSQIQGEQEGRAKAAQLLVEQSFEMLRKNNFAGAIKKLSEVPPEFDTPRRYMFHVWAEVKLGNSKTKFTEQLRKLEAMTGEAKKSPVYFLVLGLVKQAMNDPSAGLLFEKALQIDPSFVEVRRELSLIQKAKEAEKKNDLFTGDITSVVSNFFKRKAE
jgi:hypothetical protein